MQGLPFEVPPSLSSYLNQFEHNPDKAIANLESFLKKRGMDAVGYFLLSWLYHNNEQKDEALHYALKAKFCAPGSPFFQHLHYFMMHPDHFNAWRPFAPDAGTEPAAGPAPSGKAEPVGESEHAGDAGVADELQTADELQRADEPQRADETSSALNLDKLIEQLAEAEKRKIAINTETDDRRNLGEKSEKVGDIASETLAKIYEKQKKYADALRTLNKLSQTRPQKAEYYQQEIKRIRELKNSEDED